MLLRTKLKCNGCECDTVVSFKRPGLLEQVSTAFTCSGCESRMMAIIKRPNGSRDKMAMEVRVKYLQISPILEQILREESEAKAVVESREETLLKENE